MKKTALVVVLALALTFAFVAGASATTSKSFTYSTSYYTWLTPTNVMVVNVGGSMLATGPTGVSGAGANPANPGAHGGYLANTAKCGMCHSVHRAVGGGVKLMPGNDATCTGCHTGSTAITNKIVTWTPYDPEWAPVVNPASPYAPLGSAAWLAATNSQRTGAITNKAAAGGAANGGGPHNDSALDLIADGVWNGVGETPLPSYEGGDRYGCFTRRCHAVSPHGVGASKYKIFAAKLLFNESANDDEGGDGTYGGEDAVYDDLGATDAAVQRFLDENPDIMTANVAGDIFINGVAPDTAETHALVAGLTCGRPSNPSTGEDECHAEASYAIVDKGIQERRNHGTGIASLAPGVSANPYRTDNTGGEAAGFGGNDNRDWKTGHVAGSFDAVPGEYSYAPIEGCTSCHDQTDAANTTDGHFTFPHGEVAWGASNLTTDGVNPLPAKAVYDPLGNAGPGIRARIWSGYGGYMGAKLIVTAGSPEKAFDGQCLKCHRNATNDAGIGLTF